MSPTAPEWLLGEYQEIGEFARTEVKKHPKTVRRWTEQPDGLPYLKLGRDIFIHKPTARDWLRSRIRHPNPRREISQPP
jgi:hypothetical protein